MRQASTVRLLWAALTAAWLGCLAGAVAAADRTLLAAPSGKTTSTIVIHAATDLSAMQPLIDDFQTIEPDTNVEYVEYVTNDLFEVATRACKSGEPFADLVLSSAVDHLVKLANDGCATAHQSASTARVANWAQWRNEVFGFTTEPAVIVYNANHVAADEAPRTHAELADMLRTRAEFFRGRIGTYDIRLSGIGYLFAFSDLQQTSTTYGRLLESMGRLGAVVRCCSAEVLDEVAAGRLFVGYNMLGSYAYARMKKGAPIHIVLPQDYTLVLARAALIPRHGRSGSDGARFLDYLLSERGQRMGREAAFFFAQDAPPPPGVQGPPTLSGTGSVRPITIGPSLMLTQDRARRQRFIADWSRSMIDMNAED